MISRRDLIVDFERSSRREKSTVSAHLILTGYVLSIALGVAEAAKRVHPQRDTHRAVYSGTVHRTLWHDRDCPRKLTEVPEAFGRVTVYACPRTCEKSRSGPQSAAAISPSLSSTPVHYTFRNGAFIRLARARMEEAACTRLLYKIGRAHV